jgi:acetoin utilization deacetylase AcuC-like enzyme
LPILLSAAKPDIVFVQGGADVLAGDPLADLNMTPDGLVRRDAMVIDACRRRNIPVVTTIGGGYGPDAWEAQANSIARTIQTYGCVGDHPRHTPRKPTIKENLYSR